MDVEACTLGELVEILPGLLREIEVNNERTLQSIIHTRLLDSLKEVGVFITRKGGRGSGSCDFVLVDPLAYTIIEVKFVAKGCLDIDAGPLKGATSFDFKTWPQERKQNMSPELALQLLTRPRNEVFTVRNDQIEGRVISTIRGVVNQAKAQCAIYVRSARERGFRTQIQADGREIKGAVLCVFGERVVFEYI
jgi:hypothetical protein